MVGTLLEQMLWLTIEVFVSFDFVASVALDSSTEVVILTLRANPSSIGKIKIGVRISDMAMLLNRDDHLVAILSSVPNSFILEVLIFVFRKIFKVLKIVLLLLQV